MPFGTNSSGLMIKGGLKIEGCKIEGNVYTHDIPVLKAVPAFHVCSCSFGGFLEYSYTVMLYNFMVMLYFIENNSKVPEYFSDTGAHSSKQSIWLSKT